MWAKVSVWLENIRSSYWLVPTLMSLGAILLAAVTFLVDLRTANDKNPLLPFERLLLSDTGGARELLSTVSGALMTVLGVVFSMTLVVITLAASQYGARILRNFMRDTPTQVTLGVFTSTFIYALLTLRMIDSPQPRDFIPHLSITISILLTLASVFVLIAFISHLTTNIQPSAVIAAVYYDIMKSAGHEERQEDDHASSEDANPESWELTAHRSGYVEATDHRRLLALAKKHDVVICMKCRPGDFVLPGSVLLEVHPADRLSERFAKKISQAVSLGTTRTLKQDIRFAFGQMVEIILRSLSSSYNDVVVAQNSVDYLILALSHFARRPDPNPRHCDENGRLRLVTMPVSFADCVTVSLNPVAHKAKAHPEVMIHLLENIYATGSHDCQPVNRRILFAAASDFARSVNQADWSAHDRARLARVAQAMQPAKE